MGRRLSIVGIVALMAVGSLALWIAVPIAWLWVARDLQPAGLRFVITIAGCTITMAGTGVLLYRLEGVYSQITGAEIREGEPPSWMRSEREAGASRTQLSLLDGLLVGSALVALVTLIVWWAFIADSSNPSGPLQPL